METCMRLCSITLSGKDPSSFDLCEGAVLGLWRSMLGVYTVESPVHTSCECRANCDVTGLFSHKMFCRSWTTVANCPMWIFDIKICSAFVGSMNWALLPYVYEEHIKIHVLFSRYILVQPIVVINLLCVIISDSCSQ